MITIRVKANTDVAGAPAQMRDMEFEDHDKGNAWAKELFRVLGRESQFRERKVNGAVMTVHSELTFRQLHDKGISFFGATTPSPKRREVKKPERPKRNRAVADARRKKD